MHCKGHRFGFHRDQAYFSERGGDIELRVETANIILTPLFLLPQKELFSLPRVVEITP